MIPLHVIGTGMVSAVGLNRAQSVASFLAGVSGFSDMVAPDILMDTQTVARVPADWRLRAGAAEWLINLATRAAREAMEEAAAEPSTSILICCAPECERDHPCWTELSRQAFLEEIQHRLKGPFAPGSRLIEGGPAALIGALPRIASELIAGNADHAVLVGVDSMTNASDLARFRSLDRLLGQTSQGLIPGEGAGALVLSARRTSNIVLLNAAFDQEDNPVTGVRQSQGHGMLRALKSVCSGSVSEDKIDFIVSNSNGERYSAMEALIYRSRFYRSHRDTLPVAFPAMSFGDTGCASGAISLVIAADAIGRGIAPGSKVMIEVASDFGQRAAVYLVGPEPRSYDQAG